MPSSRTTIGTFTSIWSSAWRSPVRDLVAAGDPAEDVEQHGFDLVVREQHLERRHDLVRLRTAAHVEEVGGPPAGLRDDVERRHHEPGAVAEDADLAVELHVRDAAFLGHLLLRVLGGRVAHLGDLGPAGERVVVHRHLRVQSGHLPVGGDDQRVDLDEHRVDLDECVVELGHHRPHGTDDVGVDPALEGEPPAVEVLEADEGVHVQACDLLLGDRLDLHPPAAESIRSTLRALRSNTTAA